MTKEAPIFTDVTFWLSKICILPYTPDELDAIGCLGFDMKHNKEFGDKYMQKLLAQRHLITENKRVAFADLNLQLYREVLQQKDLQQIPDWISDKAFEKNSEQPNPIRARIVRLYQNLQKNTPKNKPEPEKMR